MSVCLKITPPSSFYLRSYAGTNLQTNVKVHAYCPLVVVSPSVCSVRNGCWPFFGFGIFTRVDERSNDGIASLIIARPYPHG
jgi:hypothetical protein